MLAEETKTKRKEQVERTKRIYDAQSIHPIAEMLKRELISAESFVEQLNKQLERTLYTGKQFRLSMRQKPEFGQYIRLVRTYSASNPGNLQEWLQANRPVATIC